MTKPLVAVLDDMAELSREIISATLTPDFDVAFVRDGSDDAKREIAAEAQVLLTNWGRVDADTIKAAKRCRLIQKLGVGIDKIDVDQAEKQGIVVLKSAGINADAVADLTLLLSLAVARHLAAAMAASKTGVVFKEVLRAQSAQLLDKTVGLLGFGHIGQAVARRATAFGAKVVYYDVVPADPAVSSALNVERVDFDRLLAESDILSLHVPSTPENYHIIGADALAKVKPGLILINTARGSLVDEAALVQALESGRVLGAGLDVTEDEPLSPSSPLHGFDRVILTPHVGGAVANNFPRVMERARRNALAVLNGGEVDRGDVVIWPAQ